MAYGMSWKVEMKMDPMNLQAFAQGAPYAGDTLDVDGDTMATQPVESEVSALPLHNAIEKWLSVPAWAGEMESLFRHMVDTQPAMLQVIDDLLDAFDSGNPDEFQEAVSSLLRCMTLVSGMPQYPVLSKSERIMCCEQAARHLSTLDRWPGGHGQALMVALRQAAPAKFDKFNKGFQRYLEKLP